MRISNLKIMKNLFSIFLNVYISFIIINCGDFQNGRYIEISKAEYEDKVYASWIGQIIGNIYGLPHECRYSIPTDLTV